ncbi:MAG: hypothetical protein CMP23_17615 [Rickettsiales bacterium]|nr:hypothetical protein [Rickettsiales bacterium]|tara:strand:+ start:510 stop:1559 length:1050 start_codon:yes stop_codon:yes gene_type:complete
MRRLCHPALLSLGLLLLAITASAGPASSATAWVSSNHLQVIDIDEGKVLGKLPLGEFIHSMRFTADGKRLYVGTSKALRIVDPERIAFSGQLSPRRTRAIAISDDGQHIYAVHPGDPKVSQAARIAGEPLPLATLSQYSAASNQEVRSWTVPALSSDIILTASNQQIIVLDPDGRKAHFYTTAGQHRGEQVVVPINQDGNPAQAMLGPMSLAPNGASFVIPITLREGPMLAHISLTEGPNTARVQHHSLEDRGRVQGLSWDASGEQVLITATGGICSFRPDNTEQEWMPQQVIFIDVAAVPQSELKVAVAPVFSKRNKSGGVAVLAADGGVLRTVELPDMSPFYVAVRP